jgi:hypothetical protein
LFVFVGTCLNQVLAFLIKAIDVPRGHRRFALVFTLAPNQANDSP